MPGRWTKIMIGKTEEPDEALDIVNGTKRSRLPRWTQDAIGMAIGASLIGFPALWLSDRDTLHDLDTVVEAHSVQLKEIRSFHREPRFTEKDSDKRLVSVGKDIEDTREDIKELKEMIHLVEEEHRRLIREVYELKASFQGLPPLVWQNRIINMERVLSELSGRLRNKEQ